LPRVEDLRLLTGRGRYSDDCTAVDALHCAFVRSPHAHAVIRAIDVAAARASDGVVAVLTGRDYADDGRRGMEHVANPLDAVDITKKGFTAAPGDTIAELPHWPLAIDRARHVGEAVVAVIATSAAQARDAAERVVVEYDPLPAVISPVDALAPDAPRLHDAVAGNRCFDVTVGDGDAVDGAFASAACVVRGEFVSQRIANAQMEPRAALAEIESPGGRLVVTSGNQGVHRPQVVLAQALGLPLERVRFVSPDVGGGFGPRNNLYPEQLVVAWAALRLGRPVKWSGDRSEAFLADFGGRDSVIRAALAFDAHGRITAYDVAMIGAVGAHTVTYVPLSNARNVLPTVYAIPAVRMRVTAALTNTVPTAPYRGAGRPEAHHALERLLDRAAARLGIDRVAIRERNLVRHDMLPYRTATGLTYDSGDFPGAMRRALGNADWAGFPARRAAAEARGMRAGIGVANYVETPVGAPREHAGITVHADGRVELRVGTQSTGQGHETSFAQVIADLLAVPFESVRIVYGDTDRVKSGGGTHSDRSMRIAGTLMVQTCDEILAIAREAASRLLEAAAGDLDYADGRFRVAGTDRGIGLFEIAGAMAAGDVQVDGRALLAAARDFAGRIPAYPCGAAVCEVEVDPATGVPTITRYTTVDDAGQVINPLIVHGQTHGGIVQGIGQALAECHRSDPATGQLLAGSFMDYALLRAADVPSFDVTLVEDPTRGNPLRVKGGGEGGIVPATAAVVNALCDALGVDDLPMPATAETIWRALTARAAADD
jgi:carbon-monoxide dehydrogenase large subunit